MAFEKQTDLICRKHAAGLTNRELANALGCTPGTVSAKLTGFVTLTEVERRIIEKTISDAEKANAESKSGGTSIPASSPNS